MQFKNILKNRLYVFSSDENIFDEDSLDLIQSIFKDSGFSIPEKNQIEFIDSNYNYDTYKIYFADQNVCLKISFDSNSDSLKKEFNFYKKNISNIHPKSLKYNSFKYGDLLNYSITSYEELSSINKIGFSTLLENTNLFFDCMNDISSFNRPSKDINLVTESLLNRFDLNSNIPSHTLDMLKLKYNFNAIKNLIKNLKLELKNLSNSLDNDKNVFCHGNLKPSNILFNDSTKELKIINFENHFAGHRYFDLAHLSINFNLNSVYNKDLFKSFLHFNKINYSIKELEIYNKCYSFNLVKVLIELLISYFFENFVLGQARGSKLYQIISVYSHNEENFYKIPSFKENHKLISDIFAEGVIGDGNE